MGTFLAPADGKLGRGQLSQSMEADGNRGATKSNNHREKHVPKDTSPSFGTS